MKPRRLGKRAAAWASCALALAACAHGEQHDTSGAAASATVAATAVPLASSWCRTVPLEKAFCSTLVLSTPKTTLRLAVADTDPRREHGLMGVRSVPPHEGMLFSFPDGDAGHEFWMKDTVTPLDMIFVRSDGTVTVVAAHVPATKPGTPDDRIERRRGTGKYVIELAAGGAAKAGLDEGVRLTIPDVPAQ